ncbi:MAG: HlyD family secretion protein [Pseudomonadota bacterium]
MNTHAPKKSPLKPLLAILLIGTLAGAYYQMEVRGRESTEAAQLESDIVPISAKVSGYVKEVKVRDNQAVRAGDTLLLIDPVDCRIAVNKAKAELEGATAQYEQAAQNLAVTKVSAPSSLEAAKASVASASADYDRAVRDAARNRHLKGIATSSREIEQSDAAEKMAGARLEQAEAGLRHAETSAQTIAGADAGARMLLAQIEGKKSDLDAAERKLADTEIRAPVDGKISKRTVQAGAFVQPGQLLLAMTGARLWVVANFKETQLEHLHIGQAVGIRIDAFPKMKFTGKIDSIQASTGARLSLFPPENASGNFVKVVQRVPVKINLDRPPDPALPLAPGMSVVATVRFK